MPRARGFTVVPRDPMDPGCRICESSVLGSDRWGCRAVAVTRSGGENASQWNRVETKAAGRDAAAASVGGRWVRRRMGSFLRHRMAESPRFSRGHSPARRSPVRHGAPARDDGGITPSRFRSGSTAPKDRPRWRSYRRRSSRRRSRSHPRSCFELEWTSRVDRRAIESSALRRGWRA